MRVEFCARCPHCGRTNEVHSGRSDRAPHNGDIFVCWGCRKPGIFLDGPLGMGVRQLTTAESDALMSSPDMKALFGAMAESYDPATALALWAGDGE